MSPIPNRQPGDVVNETFSEYLPPIIQMCTDAGDDPNILIEEVRNELKKMVIQMMAEDEALIDRKRTELASIRSRYESLFYELYPDRSCPNHEHSLSILPALRAYLDDYEKLREEHEKLLEQESDIREEEKQLCEELNECSLQTDSINFLNKPLINQMSLLAEHNEKLRNEKKKRIAHLSDIFKSLNEFELIYGWKRPKAETMIGQLLTKGIADIEQFSLTKESIDLIDKEFVKINEEIQKAEACFEQSNKQLNHLMRKHQSLVPSVKVLTLTKTKQCRLSKLPDLLAEVDRYQEHAMEKLTSDILKTRERIYAVLTKLAVVDAMSNSKYSILDTNEFTEDIYFMHEELLQELESQYETNKAIYEQIEIWNDLFLEYQEFERNATDPQRFHQRGYSALVEEKTRKKFEANLRDCEHRLNEIADEFIKKNNGQPFVMSGSGLEISDYIRKQKEKYLKSKEQERETSKTPASKKKARK